MDLKYLWLSCEGMNCRQFRLLFPLSFIGQYVHSVGGEWIGRREWEGEVIILARCVFYFIREHEHLVFDSIHNKSIDLRVENDVDGVLAIKVILPPQKC